MELIKHIKLIFVGIVMFMTILGLSSFMELDKKPKINSITNKKFMLTQPMDSVFKLPLLNDSIEFSKENLILYIKELDIKFPRVVIAQAILETGHFKSKLYRNNNNLFGFRQAKKRKTTSIGTKNGYAYYKTWKESVFDYHLYSKAYLSHIKTEEAYLKYLNKHYSETKNYSALLKKVMKNVKYEK